MIRCLIFFILGLWSVSVSAMQHHHALSRFDSPKYAKDFKHFDYANPNAPKGGTLKLSSTGGLDTLNGFNGKGAPAPALRLLYDTLMVHALDEPESQYGLLAKSIRTSKDKRWAEFTLREHAKWSDGKDITADDIIFTLNMLQSKGSAFYKQLYHPIVKATKISKKIVHFDFKKEAYQEALKIAGQMTILPQHYWHNKDFTTALLDPPVGSGPYKITHFSPDKKIIFQKRDDYWGKNLPVNKGLYNFEFISFDMFRNNVTQFEAFKSGQHDYRIEFDIKNWETAYDFPDAQNGQVKKEQIINLQPKPLSALIFNLRKKTFQNKALRQAISMMIDFDWLNKNLFFNSYKRSESFFENSNLKAPKTPLLNSQIHFRDRLSLAMQLLKKEDYIYKNGLLHDAAGEKVTFEILNADPSSEQFLIPILSNIKKLGIDAKLRNIDSAQYIKRTQKFDFDMMMTIYEYAAHPTGQLKNYWSSQAAMQNGSRNYAGLSDPIIDNLIEKMSTAKDYNSYINSAHALDRILQSNTFLIPLWYSPITDRIAYRNKFGKPNIKKTYGFISPIDLWWTKE